MFKLVSNLATGVCNPKLFRIPTEENTAYTRGTLLRLNENGKAISPLQNEKPTHIAVETLDKNEKSEILVYAISPDMLFEAPILYNASKVKPGMQIGFAYNSRLCADSLIGTTTNKIATVVCRCDNDIGVTKVRVKFE